LEVGAVSSNVPGAPTQTKKGLVDAVWESIDRNGHLKFLDRISSVIYAYDGGRSDGLLTEEIPDSRVGICGYVENLVIIGVASHGER
jgi:hypothetical protein